MKKTLLIAAFVALGIGTISCSSDDSNSHNYKKDIQGEWVEVETLYLNEDRKVIAREEATDNDGCGFDEVEFNNTTFFSRSPFKLSEEANCQVDIEESTYTLSERTITFTIVDGEEIEFKKSTIINVDDSTLTIEYNAGPDDFVEGVTYVQTKHKKKGSTVN
ncbi:lipocalin family protein [Myroides sp. 1354]|uniref:lipocalin family protein n=1 Tax=unclassified Myroides TaxID=2642485 RepID=UPI002574FD8C|nr:MULTISPECIES: lipocalin family protein [unclassified Myroides]MDM1044642.1 lipocalin family protein [Myroides sp. R163-1]MDM1055355.1 lipocalin family protein [Myroides sp. 1354]MDM1068652.1 lipocalin family protein [Myroides sp. 1372]